MSWFVLIAAAASWQQTPRKNNYSTLGMNRFSVTKLSTPSVIFLNLTFNLFADFVIEEVPEFLFPARGITFLAPALPRPANVFPRRTL